MVRPMIRGPWLIPPLKVLVTDPESASAPAAGSDPDIGPADGGSAAGTPGGASPADPEVTEPLMVRPITNGPTLLPPPKVLIVAPAPDSAPSPASALPGADDSGPGEGPAR